MMFLSTKTLFLNDVESIQIYIHWFIEFALLLLQVAPFNTYYAQLGEHMAQVGVDPTINKWDQPFVLGAVDPHDSLSHPAGVSDAQAESATSLDPDLFTNFVVRHILI